MDFSEYLSNVKKIRVGKHLPDAIYLHNSALTLVPERLTVFLQLVIDSLALNKIDWNIVKFHKKGFKLSLLDYPGFFIDSYPALDISYTIDLNSFTFRKTNYSKSQNPPILHRKETFLLPDHPQSKEFAEITKEGEAAGLYQNTKRIGFKQNWNQTIALQGYKLVNGRLHKRDKKQVPDKPDALSENQKIERHKTAIDRNSLSSPMQSLFRQDFLNGTYSLFDYGCGKGDDLNILANHNISAAGWDPTYYPENKIKSADIVN
ncbi:MAG: hypothetical protein GY705_00490, partial [Bacteroidetes bacterium]|nr:hypothetical protein [Bacteroidota bacterium]